MSRRNDWFGNPVVYFAVQSAHPVLAVTARSTVERDDDDAARYQRSTATWDEVAARTRSRTSPDGLDARQFLFDSPMLSASPEIRAYALPSFPADRPLLEAVTDLISRIHRDFTYEPGTTTIATPLARVLAQRRGLPGLRARRDRLPALDGNRGAIRLGLSRNRAAARQGAAHRRRRVARLVRGVGPRRRLARLRSHERRPGALTPHHDRLGPRLRRRDADEGHHLRRRHVHTATVAVDVERIED